MHSKADRIYRLNCDIKTPSETLNISANSAPMAISIKQDFSQVESVVRISQQSLLLRKGDVKFQEENAFAADSTFFNVFDFPLIKGNKQTVLKEPFSIVLSETAAKKYFGSENPVGKNLLITGDGLNATITGVMKDIPENTHFRPDLLISLSTYTQNFNKGADEQWGNFWLTSYILLKPGTNAKSLEKQFPAFLEKRDGKEMKESQMYFTLTLEPLRDVYLKSKRDGYARGNINNVYIFSLVALFILIIACINFINLTTARSSERAKEVGIRKVVGAVKFQLAGQFISESVIISIASFFISVILCALLLPLFNQLAGKQVSDGIFTHPLYILTLFFISIAIGIVAGIYPSLVLSSFKPIAVLKGRFATSSGGLLLRKALVIVQFTMSIALIVGTIVVYNQLNYMRNQDLGFKKDQMLILDTHNDKNKTALKESISSIPGVVSTALSSSVPGGGNPGAYSKVENKSGDMQTANLDLYFVDFDYIPQYKMKFLAGRSFSKEFGTDTTQAMVVNESTVKLLGYSSPQQAIGKKFDQWGRQGKIIGVVKDFHFRSLQEPIKPLTLRIEPGGCNLISVNLSGGNLPATVKAIEAKWKELIPDRPFEYVFLNDSFNKQYKSEENFGNLFLNFAILAIFISCLGLLGLASYSTLQRTKEIGVRKVLGASVSNIVNLLSIEFLKLVGIAFIIASPIAWFVMNKWLQGFAYKNDLSWWIFLLAGFLAVIIAFTTISFQAIKAALTNPVKSLRTE